MVRPRRAVIILVLLGLFAAIGIGVYLRRQQEPSPHLHAAQVALTKRDFTGALAHLEQHLAEFPGDVEARLLAARTARRAGDISTFYRHIELHKQSNGNSAIRAFEYQLLQTQQGDLSEGSELLAANRIGPDAALAQEAVIEGCLVALRNRDGRSGALPAGTSDPAVQLGMQAVVAWLGAGPTEPDLVQGMIWRGRLRIAGRDYAGGVADLREAVRHDPAHPDANMQLALAVLTNDPAEAATHLERVRELRNDDRNVLTALAAAYRSLGRLAAARQLLQTLIAKDANDVRSLLELGLVELDAGHPQEAEQYLRKAVELVPKDPPILLAMSRCMLLAGKPAEAERFQQLFDEAQIQMKAPWRKP